MNAQVVKEVESTPEIKSLIRKKQESERKLPLFQSALEAAEARHSKAKAQRMSNLDPDKASEYLLNERQEQSSLEAAAEPLRVIRANIETLEKQISAASDVFHEREANRLIEEYRVATAESDKELQTVLRKKRAESDKYLTEINHHRPSYPNIVAYGAAKFYLGDGIDVLNWREAVSVEVGPTRTSIRMLRTK